MIRRILVALDTTERAPAVLAAADEIAAQCGATLIPVRALLVPPEFPAAARTSREDALARHMHDEVNAEMDARLAGLAAEHVDATVIAHGDAWRAIVEAAETSRADLIVMGSHAYGGLDRVLGTIAAKVVDHAKRNVLVVHAGGAR